MSEVTDNEEKRPEALLQAYRDRLKTLRYAQEHSQAGEIPQAVEKYTQYLAVLATYYKTQEHQLSPKLFDPDKDLTEMLLVSHVYWDLAKAYDRSPKLQKECIRCIQQFISFSQGFKFQHVNAQMLKKFIKSKKAHNTKAFQQALDRLNVQSKSCYIATYAYPDNEYEVLSTLRHFKLSISKHSLGQKFINTYYDLSPSLVRSFEQNPWLGKPIRSLVIRPFLLLTTWFIKVLFNGNN